LGKNGIESNEREREVDVYIGGLAKVLNWKVALSNVCDAWRPSVFAFVLVHHRHPSLLGVAGNRKDKAGEHRLKLERDEIIRRPFARFRFLPLARRGVCFSSRNCILVLSFRL
jgi:hypothetical protein